MRKSLFFVIIILLLLGGTPYIMGYLAKKSYVEAVEYAGMDSHFSIVLEEYRMGWNQSEAKVKFYLKDPELRTFLPANLRDQWVLESADIIRHGPVLRKTMEDGKKRWLLGRALMRGEITANPDILSHEVIATLTGLSGVTSIPVLRLDNRTLITLGGNYQYTTTMLPTGAEGPGIFRLKLDGFTSNGLMSSDFTVLESTVDFGAINMQFSADGKRGEISVGPISAQSAVNRKNDFNVAVGEALFKMPGITVKGDDVGFAMEDLAFSAGQTLDGDSVDIAMQFSLASVDVDSEHYGPAAFQFSALGLDAEIWAYLEARLREIGSDSSLTAEQRDASLMFLMPKMLELVNKGIILEVVTLQVETPQGKVSMQGKVSFAESQNSSPNPMLALQNLMMSTQASTALSFPRSLAEQLLAMQIRQQMQYEQNINEMVSEESSENTLTRLALTRANEQIDAFIAQGMLVEEGDILVFSASYEQGQVEVNGTPMSIPLLF